MKKILLLILSSLLLVSGCSSKDNPMKGFRKKFDIQDLIIPTDISIKQESLGEAVLVEEGEIETKDEATIGYRIYEFEKSIDVPYFRYDIKTPLEEVINENNSIYKISGGATGDISPINKKTRNIKVKDYFLNCDILKETFNFSISGIPVLYIEELANLEKYDFDLKKGLDYEVKFPKGELSTQLTLTNNVETYYSYELRMVYSVYIVMEYTKNLDGTYEIIGDNYQGISVYFKEEMGYGDFVKYAKNDNEFVYADSKNENTIYLADYYL